MIHETGMGPSASAVVVRPEVYFDLRGGWMKLGCFGWDFRPTWCICALADPLDDHIRQHACAAVEPELCL